MDHAQWDNAVADGLHFLEHSVLQVPFFLMTLMRYITPTLDDMFMESLRWVDQTYIQKHKSEDPHSLRAMYYPNLKMYPTHGPKTETKTPLKQALTAFAIKYGRKAGISLVVLTLSYLPYVGRFVLPAASFYTFQKSVGPQPAVAIFAGALIMPKRYLVSFLQSYFSSRTLMRELVSAGRPSALLILTASQLEPYFARVRYTKEQKAMWFKDRAGVLFGFGLGFYVFVKIPLVGVLIYGLAEASTAYLITKVTEPPPAPSEAERFKQEDVRWKNKHEFLSLPWHEMDAYNLKLAKDNFQSEVRQTPRKTFS